MQHISRARPPVLAPPAFRETLNRFEFALACAVVFFAPVNVLRLEAFYFTASDAFACVCFAFMIVSGRIPSRFLGAGTGYWLFGLGLMVGTLLVSSLIAGVVDRGLILSAQYGFAYFLLPIILLARPWRQTLRLMKVFVVSIVVMIVHGIYVVHVVGETNTQWVSGAGRLLGFVERENECGSLLALTVPMLLAMTANRVIPTIVGILTMALLVYGIMLTGSNSALYALLFAVAAFAFASMTVKRMLQAIIFAVAFWAFISVPELREFLPAAFQKRVLIGLETGDLSAAGTFSDRLALIKEALRLGSDVFFIGYGADQYREISEWGAPVHNLYLLLWNEGGALCFAGFLAMLAGVGILIVTASNQVRNRNYVVSAGSTAVTFAVMVNAMPHVYGRFWVVPLLLSLAPLATAAMYGPRFTVPHGQQSQRTRRSDLPAHAR